MSKLVVDITSSISHKLNPEKEKEKKGEKEKGEENATEKDKKGDKGEKSEKAEKAEKSEKHEKIEKSEGEMLSRQKSSPSSKIKFRESNDAEATPPKKKEPVEFSAIPKKRSFTALESRAIGGEEGNAPTFQRKTVNVEELLAAAENLKKVDGDEKPKCHRRPNSAMSNVPLVTADKRENEAKDISRPEVCDSFSSVFASD